MARIHLMVGGARKLDMSGLQRPGDWAVLHPSNDSVLAYCKTEADADEVISLFTALAGKYENE